MARPKLWTERILLPLAEGTTDALDAMLAPGESRLDLIRQAVDAELRRRRRDRRRESKTLPAEGRG